MTPRVEKIQLVSRFNRVLHSVSVDYSGFERDLPIRLMERIRHKKISLQERSLLGNGWTLIHLDNAGHVLESWCSCKGEAHAWLRLMNLSPEDKRVSLFSKHR